MPILLKLANGSAQGNPQPGASPLWIDMVNAGKAKLIGRISETEHGGVSIFVGPESIVRALGVETD